jgi:ribosomal subunit interface protein
MTVLCVVVVLLFVNLVASFLHGTKLRSCMGLHAIPSIAVKGNVEATAALRGKIDEKLGHIIEKYGARTTSASVTLKTVSSDLTQSAKATKVDTHHVTGSVTMKGGAVLKVEAKSEDMYKSIDIVAHELSAIMKKHKDRARTLKTKGGAKAKEANLPDDELLLSADPVEEGDFDEYEEDPMDTQAKIDAFLGRK